MSFETLHNLDLGIPRFLEFSLTVVLKCPIDPSLYAAKLREFLAAWPILTTRMNRLRTKLVQSNHDRFDDIWRLQTINASLNTIVPGLLLEEKPFIVDSSVLEDLFRPPVLQKPTRVTMPPVFELRIATFTDGAALKFIVQHPMCDASGLYMIVSAYCNILNNRNLTVPRPRVGLSVIPGTASDINSSDDDPIDAQTFAQNHREYYSEGWFSLVGKGVKQWTGRLHGRKRISRAVLIPQTVIDNWRALATSIGVRTSRNDLLMAWVYLCSYPDLAAKHLPFAFVLNYEGLLKESGDLHNPWCMISVTPLPEVDAVALMKGNQNNAVVAIAKHMRNIINHARSAGTLQEIINEHEHVNKAPITPRRFGHTQPDLRMSSWAHLNLWKLEFSTSLKDDKRKPDKPQFESEEFLPVSEQKTTNPIWAMGNIDFCPAFQWVNLSLDDTLVTWSEDRGYWIQGNLHEDVWARISQFNPKPAVGAT